MRIFGFILLALLAQQRPGPATASIKGVVVKVGTSEPVAKAVVELRQEKGDPVAVATGADGRFEFRNLPAGSYQLTATRSGYLDTAYGQRGPSGSGGNLAVASGANMDNIRLIMTATGAIAGRVFDNTGEPLANVPVQALKYSYDDGQRTLTEIKVDETNDLGEFRLFWLPPGQYIISAKPQDSRPEGKFFLMHKAGYPAEVLGVEKSVDASAGKLGEAYVPVYYPGTTNPQSATRVEVRPGGDVRGIDFSLTRVNTRKVRGTVVDSTTGLPVTEGSIQLTPREGGALQTSAVSPGDDGRFEISGALPGSYFLVATARLGSPENVRVLLGRTPVEIGNSDLSDLVVTLRPTIDLSGTVAVEGRAEGLPDDTHPVVSLRGSQSGIFGGLSQIDGGFTSRTEVNFTGVPEGDYRVVWSDLPSNIYVKSMSLGPLDALKGTIAIDPRASDRVQIVFGTNGGKLEGIVLDKARNAVGGARVVLVPDAARRERADLYKSASSDDSGRFQFGGIAPGDYSLFAWEDIENGLWQDPEFLRRHEGSGRPVRILENGRETIETVAIPFAF